MTADLENRCVDIIGKLWNVVKRKSHSELPRLAPLKRACSADQQCYFRWKKLADAAGVDRFTKRRPNLVISSAYQVCWEKFCRYWDIEMRTVPIDLDHLSL